MAIDLSATSRFNRVVADIRDGYCKLDDLKDAGAHLWSGVVNDVNERIFREMLEEAGAQPVYIALDVPKDLAQLPWESIYDETCNRFFLLQPQIRFIRSVQDAAPPSPSPSLGSNDKLRALVVIPDVADLNAGQEWTNIKRIFESAEIAERVHVDRLEGRVTIDRLDDAIRDGNYDIFHFIGHGELDEKQNVTIRLNQEDGVANEFWANGESFAELFSDSSIRLAVLNCCFASQSSANRRTSGLGEGLLNRGLSSVVAMQFEVDDEQAIQFSETFYKELLLGKTPGQVGEATRLARRKVHMNSKDSTRRGFIAPVLFTRPDADPTFAINPNQDKPVSTLAAPPTAAVIEDTKLPPGLVNAVRNGRCLPVIGHHFLSESTTRRGPSTGAGPLRLARFLAAKCDYPAMDELDIGETSAAWWASSVLQRVCEFYVSRETGLQRIDLCEAIRDHYDKNQVPESFRSIAGWNIPGAICTYFDGLLARAFEEDRRYPKVLSNAAQSTEDVDEEPRLVHICGLPREPESLVLTETDHDMMFDRLEEPDGTRSCMVNSAYGLSVLMLGVSPRDPMVRRLASILLRADAGRGTIPIHFVSTEDEPLARLFWGRFNVSWYQTSPEEFVQQLTGIASEDAQ
ncbi:MAG: CHAT domain-containing protein [Paracoccaceae bacterium]|nr:CHAT domain-containing protein [Paracoccaceae bacterium]